MKVLCRVILEQTPFGIAQIFNAGNFPRADVSDLLLVKVELILFASVDLMQ